VKKILILVFMIINFHFLKPIILINETDNDDDIVEFRFLCSHGRPASFKTKLSKNEVKSIDISKYITSKVRSINISLEEKFNSEVYTGRRALKVFDSLTMPLREYTPDSAILIRYKDKDKKDIEIKKGKIISSEDLIKSLQDFLPITALAKIAAEYKGSVDFIED